MLSFLPRGVLDEILNLIESVSEVFPSYSYYSYELCNLVLPSRGKLLFFKLAGTGFSLSVTWSFGAQLIVFF